MTTWILVIYLASGAAIEQRTPYADAATPRFAPEPMLTISRTSSIWSSGALPLSLHAQARVLHALDPDHTATVAWVACEPRTAALEAQG